LPTPSGLERILRHGPAILRALHIDGPFLRGAVAARLLAQPIPAIVVGRVVFSWAYRQQCLLVADKLFFPEINLFTWRLVAGFAGILVLLYGIIWDAD